MADIPAEMTVIAQQKPGGPETLRPERRPVPRPRCGEVLVKVAAAGCNGADLLQREGRYPNAPDEDVLGLEVSGTVVALGPDVTRWKVGDKVAALTLHGGYGEYVAVPEVQCLPVPKGVSMVEAAGLPETVLTVWANVFEHGALKPGEILLVQGGSSGIGTTAIQLARALGSRVVATAGSAEKCRRCEELGAFRAINYREEDFVTAAKEATGGTGVDVVLDMVGGDYVQRGLEALAYNGRLVMLGFKREKQLQVDGALIQAKHLVLTGSRLRARTVVEKGRLVAAVRKAVWPLVESGQVKTIVDSVYPLAEARRAHERMESGQHIGKVLLEMERAR